MERQFHAGELPWNYKTVQSLIGDYPKHGHLDEIKVGQEDEATEDPDGVPWEPAGDEQEQDADSDAPIADLDPADRCELPSPKDEIHGDGDDLWGMKSMVVEMHSLVMKSAVAEMRSLVMKSAVAEITSNRRPRPASSSLRTGS